MPRFVLSGSNPGLLVRGTIDIYARPVVLLKNGSVATVRSESGEIDFRGGKAEMLYPTVVGKRIVSSSAARAHSIRTGLHLGIFDNAKHATSYALRLHDEQARFYRAKIARLRAKKRVKR